MASFIYEKKEAKGQGRRQFIMSRYGVRFHFGHATSDLTEIAINIFQQKCLLWLDSLTQKEVDHYRNNYYKSTAYVGRAKVESDYDKGKLKKPDKMPIGKPIVAANHSRASKKSIKKSFPGTLNKATKKATQKAAKRAVEKSATK